MIISLDSLDIEFKVLIGLAIFILSLYLSSQSIKEYRRFKAELEIFYKKNINLPFEESYHIYGTGNMYLRGIIFGFFLYAISYPFLVYPLTHFLGMTLILFLLHIVIYVVFTFWYSKKCEKELRKTGIKEYKILWYEFDKEIFS